MSNAGFDLDLWSLLGLAGSAGLGLVGKVLGGWRGYLVSFVAGAALATFVAFKIAGWQAAERERDQLRTEVLTLTITNAADDALHRAQLADKDRALAAVEAVAAAAQAAAADLAARIERLRRAYQAQGSDPELSPAGQSYYDDLRAKEAAP